MGEIIISSVYVHDADDERQQNTRVYADIIVRDESFTKKTYTMNLIKIIYICVI